MYVGTSENVNNFFLYHCLINRDFYDKKEVFVNVKQGDKWKVFKKKNRKQLNQLPNIVP